MNLLNACPQRGQAALETLLALFAFASLWVGVAWLARIQDISLHAFHAARYSAFIATRDEGSDPLSNVEQALFSGEGARWADQRGRLLRDEIYTDIEAALYRSTPLAASAQAGGDHSVALRLRRDWLIEDDGIATAHIGLAPRHKETSTAPEASLLGLQALELLYPKISSQIAILTGAGHASSDTQAADRVAQSTTAWSAATAMSRQSGRRIEDALAMVDSAWNRNSPVYDWLRPWADRVPVRHLGVKDGH